MVTKLAERWLQRKGYTVIAPSYRLGIDGKSITCLRCGMTSYNRSNIANRFCGKCQIFHDDIRWLAEYRRYGIDPLYPNPDGSDFHIMNAIDDKLRRDAK